MLFIWTLGSVIVSCLSVFLIFAVNMDGSISKKERNEGTFTGMTVILLSWTWPLVIPLALAYGLYRAVRWYILQARQMYYDYLGDR